MRAFLVRVLLAAGSASALQLHHGRAVLPLAARRASPLRLAEDDGEMEGWRTAEGEEKLSAEQLTEAYKAAATPEQLQERQRGVFESGGTDPTVGPKEGFDPRILLYVSLPALVLIGQLFFTFSRDALGDAALGPAVMDVWVP